MSEVISPFIYIIKRHSPCNTPSQDCHRRPAPVQAWLLLFLKSAPSSRPGGWPFGDYRHGGGWAVAAILLNWFAVFLLGASSYRYGQSSPRVAGRACGYLESPGVIGPGSAWLQILLLCCCLIPGIAYAT